MAGNTSDARRFAGAAEPLHSCSYYAPEVAEFTALGFKGWWNAYFAYRAAPLGNVSADLVTELFYNFAPRMVERSVPACWEILPAATVRERQNLIVGGALSRIFHDYPWEGELEPVADLLSATLQGLDYEHRPLSVAWSRQAWPESGVMRLWHATTVLREYRFDGHNLALREAGISGIGSHLLMVADGRGTPEVIQKIRGWTPTEWSRELAALQDSGLLDKDGLHTERGRSVRRDIEFKTDLYASAVPDKLGRSNTDRVLSLLERVSKFLLERGEVPGKWPPAHLGRIDPSSA